MSLPLISFLFSIFLLLSHGCVFVAPVLAPNTSSCHLPLDLPSDEPVFNCCPPAASYRPRLFRPNSSSSLTLRVRAPAHSVSPEYAEKLARAYDLMKALPAGDPRSFIQQANIHCAYCNTIYNQMNSSQLFQVHGSWLFLPFHRWYLYFHERILAKLLGEDDSFALPFWNYDHPEGASMPWLYTSFNATLTSPSRDPLHVVPGSTVGIDNPAASTRRPREVQLRENANAMYRVLIRDASTQKGFFGSPYRQGDPPFPGYGTIEEHPHNSVHVWVGNKTAVGLKDMGSFYAAARDPVFYAHHAQLDRLWEIWKTIPDHEELRDKEYLDSEFAFYNEDAELVRVKVGDALETAALGYVYAKVETPWIDAISISCSSGGPAVLNSSFMTCVKEEDSFAPCSFLLQRDVEGEREAASGLDERLGLTVQCDPTEGTHIDIYLNLPSADENTTTGCAEFLSSIDCLTPSAVATHTGIFNFTKSLGITERLVDLNLTGQRSIVVTLMPSFFTASPRKGFSLLNYFVVYAPQEVQGSKIQSSSNSFNSISAL